MPGVREIVAVELDPLACLVTRANLAVTGISKVRVVNGDFTHLELAPTTGRRAFVGNPPYVRHHELDATQKQHGKALAKRVGVGFSGLAGLHMYFVLAAAALAKLDDILCFITSAEWLDVNYGQGMRDLLLDGLRAEQIHVLDAAAIAFDDAASTAAIICARSGGSAEQTQFKVAPNVSALLQFDTGGHAVRHSDLKGVRAWGRIARQEYHDLPHADLVKVGSIMRVHRGAVTGANEFFVLTKERAAELGVLEWCKPAITAAEEVFESKGVVRDSPQRRVLLCPGEDVDPEAHPRLLEYLAVGDALGIPARYVASHRRQWWRPQTRIAPPIVATYMARQAPAFALNPDGLLLLNVAHGLYPKVSLTKPQLRELAESLNASREGYRGNGRTYHGGLEKFEPREMERLAIRLAPDRLALLCDAS